MAAACGQNVKEEEAQLAPILINPQALTASVTIDTMQSFPGTHLHGSGIGPGGGTTCGRLAELNAYRTDTKLVFRIEEENDFCWNDDLYEVLLLDVVWKGRLGAMIFSNLGDPRQSGEGFAYFSPNEGTGFFISRAEIPVVQSMDSATDNYLYLSVPLSFFTFMTDLDSNSVFEVKAQIERSNGNGTFFKVDFTDVVLVDFVDPQSVTPP